MLQRGAAGDAGGGAALPVAGHRDRGRGPGLRQPRDQHAAPEPADPADRHHAAAGHGYNHDDAKVS